MQLIMITGAICLILLGLFNIKVLKWFPTLITRLVIGALTLFFVNLLTGSIGLHVPINMLTATMVGFCGIPGVIALNSLFFFVL